jgi:hypothetical protein
MMMMSRNAMRGDLSGTPGGVNRPAGMEAAGAHGTGQPQDLGRSSSGNRSSDADASNARPSDDDVSGDGASGDGANGDGASGDDANGGDASGDDASGGDANGDDANGGAKPVRYLIPCRRR